MATRIRDISGDEIAVFADLIHELAIADSKHDPRRLVSERIMHLMQCDTMASYVWNSTSKRYDNPVCVNQDSNRTRIYLRDMQFHDPLTKAMSSCRGATVVTEKIPEDHLRNMEFYRAFLRPLDLHRGINVFIDLNDGDVLDLRLWRSERRGDFERRDVDLLNTLSIHFGNAYEKYRDVHKLGAQLTVREREVAELVARGCTDNEICGMLGIRFPTVRTHINKCFDKIGVTNRAELSARFSATLSRRL